MVRSWIPCLIILSVLFLLLPLGFSKSNRKCWPVLLVAAGIHIWIPLMALILMIILCQALLWRKVSNSYNCIHQDLLLYQCSINTTTSCEPGDLMLKKSPVCPECNHVILPQALLFDEQVRHRNLFMDTCGVDIKWLTILLTYSTSRILFTSGIGWRNGYTTLIYL